MSLPGLLLALDKEQVILNICFILYGVSGKLTMTIRLIILSHINADTWYRTPPPRISGFQNSSSPCIPQIICNAATSIPGMDFSVAATLRIMPGCTTPPCVMPQYDTLQVCSVLSATPSAMPGMVFGQTLRCGCKIRGEVHSPGLIESTKEAHSSGLKFVNCTHQDYMPLL